MLDLRASVVPLAAPAGLALALGLWLLIGRDPPAIAAVAGLETRLAAARPVATSRASAVDALTVRALGSPVFALTTGPAAVADIPVTMTGIALTRTRKAALISVGAKPADWLDLGATRDGVTLMSVTVAGATVDTPTGFKALTLNGGGVGPASAPPPVK